MSSPFGYRALIVALAVALSSCSSKLSSFDVIGGKDTGPTHQISRSDLSAQGGGYRASASGGHSIERVTIGGSYERSVVAPSGAAGTHGIAAGMQPAPGH